MDLPLFIQMQRRFNTPMRIIAGEFRGRPLLSPESDSTRPITDRAKQSLFDILAPLIPDSVVYDIFAGTGSMGLECLSRGAKQAVFFELDKTAVALLRRNITTFKVERRSRVVPGDIFGWFNSREATDLLPADLVFFDPPYRFVRERAKELLATALAISKRLTPGSRIVFRHDAADQLELPPLRQYDLRTYGGMAIELLTIPDSPTDADPTGN